MTALRTRFIEDMQLHGFSPKTQDCYVVAVRGLARYFNKSPDLVTEEALRRYAAAYGIDLASWHLLTGAPDDVTRVIRAFGLATVAGDRIAHGSLVVLVDAEGRIAEKRTDLELAPDRLLASLRKLLG